MEKLFILQLIAHVITDFFLQTDKMCKKKKDGFKTWHLYWHALLTASIAWAFSFSCKYWMYAFIIGVLHLCMDGVKSRMQKYKYIFFVDQSIHLIIITLAIYIYQQHAEIVLPTYVPSAKWLLYILGFLICLKPTNIAVQKVLSIDDKKKKNDIEQESCRTKNRNS